MGGTSLYTREALVRAVRKCVANPDPPANAFVEALVRAVRKCVPFPLTALVSVPKGTSYGRAETSSKSLYSSEYGLF